MLDYITHRTLILEIQNKSIKFYFVSEIYVKLHNMLTMDIILMAKQTSSIIICIFSQSLHNEI